VISAKAHRDFVGNHLRRGAHGAEERILRVRGPAGDDDAVDADRTDRQQIEHPGIDVGQHPARREGNHGPGGQCRCDGHHRAEDKELLVGGRREQDFLEKQLEAVGNRLQETPRTDPVGADANLHPADDLALPEGQVGDRQHQGRKDQDDLEQRPDQWPYRLDRWPQRPEQA
jgi:hypothetical protein